MHTHTHTHTQQKQGRIRLIMGNCDQIEVPSSAAIISDPPWGGGFNTDYSRFGFHRKNGIGRNWKRGIPGDDRPFDPSRWLAHDKVILFGFQFFAGRLPRGTVLVWLKKSDGMLGRWLSDAELAWQRGGKGCYVFRHRWQGCNRETERGEHYHPTQKPVALMRWCIERLHLPKSTLIVDPYMGSGSTGVAAVQLGYRFLGCELDPEYFAVAKRRVLARLILSRGQI